MKQRYIELLHSVHACGASEHENCHTPALPPELIQELETLWHTGQLSTRGQCYRGESFIIRDFGQWNRGEGPVFLRIELELEDKWVKGQAVLTEFAEDWNKLGYHQDKHYADVILQICLHPVGDDWESLTVHQRKVLIVALDETIWRRALCLPTPLDASKLRLCKAPLEHMPLAQLINLFQAAANYRVSIKRNRFEQQAAALGRSQAWYEAWAESLGYYQNRRQMKLLAKRAPLAEIQGERAEAILLGTAGFLSAVMEDKAQSEDRAYHRFVWDIWWPCREAYELQGSRAPHWSLGAQRPMNHPHRRVAALALTVQRWSEFEALLRADQLSELERFRKSIEHPYWSFHSALPSLPSARPCALVGQERMRDFIINHLLVNDESPLAWQLYLKAKGKTLPTKIQKIASMLFGQRHDLDELLHHCYAQQAILQIGLDFAVGAQDAQRFPEELLDW